jgi:Tfp pilus assembly protein PilN
LSALGIENKKEQIITASFPTDILKNFQSECKVYGVVFEGVVSLQGVFLALHAAKQKELNESLILLCENSIFAFFPKDSRSGGVMMRNISLDSGVHQSAGDTTARFRNMLHRLEPDLSALSVYTTSLYDDNETGNSTVRNKNNERPLLKIVKRSIDLSNNPKTVSEIFFEEFPEAEEKKVKFEDIKTLFFRTVTSAEYGNLDAPCPMAVLPAAAMAKNRKADIAAAVIAGGAVLYVLTVGGFLFIKNYYLRRHNIQARRFLTKEQNLNKEKEKLKIQLEKYRKIFSLINEGKAGNQKCLEFMRDIAAVIPYGVKLDFMKYSENNIELQGSTLSQGAFSLFCSKLDKVLKDLNLKIESSSLKQNSAKKKTFELKITNRSR